MKGNHEYDTVSTWVVVALFIVFTVAWLVCVYVYNGRIY